MAETKRKLMALGAIRLEQDQTTAQLQVQKVRSGELGGVAQGGSGDLSLERLRAPRKTRRLSFVSNRKKEG